jgi:hypothetical protein
MRSTLTSCYIEASAAYMGVGRLLQRETDPGRIVALERAQRHLEHGHQMLGRLMEEEPMPTGIREFFRCLFGMENWRSRRPEQAIAENSPPKAEIGELTPASQVAAAGRE